MLLLKLVKDWLNWFEHFVKYENEQEQKMSSSQITQKLIFYMSSFLLSIIT